MSIVWGPFGAVALEGVNRTRLKAPAKVGWVKGVKQSNTRAQID